VVVGESPYLLPNLKFVHDVGRQAAQTDNTNFVTLTDFTGNGYSAQQLTSANQWKYRTNVQNGLPAIQSGGTVEFMDIGLLDLLNNKSGSTYGCVYRKTDTTTTTQQTIFHIHQNSSAATTGRLEIVPSRATSKNTGGFAIRADGDSAVYAEAGGYDNTSVHFMAVVCNYTAGTVTLYVDGQLIITQQLTTSGNTTASNSYKIRYGSRTNGVSSQTNYFKGYLFEDFFCDTALGKPYLDAMWSYARAKYAL
jgi:hypothetical protein